MFGGRILVCKKPIQPSGVGEGIVGVISVSVIDLDMEVGARFDLREGFSTLIANANVIEVISKN